MAVLVLRSSPPPVPSTVPWPISNQVCSGLICGEDINPSAPCYIGADDLVYMCGGSGVTAATDPGAKVHGFATEKCRVAQRDAVTLVDDLDWGLLDKTGPNAVQSGTDLYLDVSTTAKGRFATTSGLGGALKPIGFTEPGGRARLSRKG